MNRQELEKKTIAALRALAKSRGVALRPTLKKREMIELLIKTISPEEREKAETPPAAKEAPPAKMGAHAGEGEARDEKVIFSPAPFTEIPREYGANAIVALVRDPWRLFAYWEVTPEGLGEGNQRVADPETRLTLRIYDVTDSSDLGFFWDIEVFQRIGNWYIDVGRPDRTFLIDIGVKSQSGRFATIGRSNLAHTPPAGPSDRLDEEWWTIEEFEQKGVSPFDEGRRLPLEPIEREVREALAANLFSLSLLRK